MLHLVNQAEAAVVQPLCTTPLQNQLLSPERHLQRWFQTPKTGRSTAEQQCSHEWFDLGRSLAEALYKELQGTIPTDTLNSKYHLIFQD